jgi:signal transduction histidine kinase
VWSFRDVSDRKQGEERLRTAARRDRQAVERLQALDETKNMFLTAVSHELRTPLAAVKGFAHTLHDRDADLDPARRREFLERLTVNAEKLEHLLGGLLDLDRISRGVLEPRRQSTDMASLVRRVVDALDLDRPLRVVVERVEALVDAGMLERVVENLLANAAKHTPDGTPIDVWVGRSEDDVVITVSDRGPGISDALKEAIFEPFHQGPTPAHSPGTGIGLSLVAKFVALHGGRCWVEDREGGGSSFHVHLPAETAPIEATFGAKPTDPGTPPSVEQHVSSS